MKKFVEILLKDGIGAIGDKMNDHVCPLVLYQPKACKRGEILNENQSPQRKEDNKKGI
ncbi:MAG: hypothetical protein K1W19_06365 [Lachnospiraceae bacterium]